MKLVNPNFDTLSFPGRKGGSVGSGRGQLVGGCGPGAWPGLQRASRHLPPVCPPPPSSVLEPWRPGGSVGVVLPRCPDEWPCSCHPPTRRLLGAVTLPGADAFPPHLRKPRCAPASWPCGVVGPSGAPAGAAQLSVGAPPPCSRRRRPALSLRVSLWTRAPCTGTGRSARPSSLDTVLRGLATRAQCPGLRAWGHHRCCRPAPHRAAPVSSDGQAPPRGVSQLLPPIAGPCAVLRGGEGLRGPPPPARGAHPVPGPGSPASGGRRLPDIVAVPGKPPVWPWLVASLSRRRP